MHSIAWKFIFSLDFLLHLTTAGKKKKIYIYMCVNLMKTCEYSNTLTLC